MEVVSLNNEYPCCSRAVRFTAPEAEKKSITKQCRPCKRVWKINRKKITANAVARIDRLSWKEATKP